MKALFSLTILAFLSGCQVHYAKPPAAASLRESDVESYRLTREGNAITGYTYRRSAEPFEVSLPVEQKGTTDYNPLFASFPETESGMLTVKRYQKASDLLLVLGLATAFSGLVTIGHEPYSTIGLSTGGVMALSSLAMAFLSNHEFGSLGEAYNAALEQAVTANQNLNALSTR